MSKIAQALRDTGVFYVATVDAQGQPRVRPFGAVAEFEGKVYICTNNTKKCYKEMIENPKIEISGMYPDHSWLRLTAKAIRDDRDEARAAILEANEGLKRMYSVGDGIFEVLYLEDPICLKCTFAASEKIED